MVGHPIQGEILLEFFDFVAGKPEFNLAELELVQNLLGNQSETNQALYFAAVHKIRPLVKLHEFDEASLLFDQLATYPNHAYKVVKN